MSRNSTFEHDALKHRAQKTFALPKQVHDSSSGPGLVLTDLEQINMCGLCGKKKKGALAILQRNAYFFE